MHVLFANTGVQLLCIPLAPGERPPAEATGKGWQYCGLGGTGGKTRLPYVQWQILDTQGSSVRKLFLAVDTTCGPPQDGYVCSAEILDRDYRIPLDVAHLLSPLGQPLGLRTPV